MQDRSCVYHFVPPTYPSKVLMTLDCEFSTTSRLSLVDIIQPVLFN